MGIDRVPYTLVIAPDGTVRWSAYGTVRTQELVDRLREPAPPSGGTVYLTFDDFPARRGSHELLDALRAAGVSATFFCIGTNAVKMPDLLRRAKREGHSLQVHSWDHDSKNPDLKRCADAIQNLCGTRPTFYRPPGSELVLRIGGAPLSAPVADPYDFSRPGTAELTRRVLLKVRPGSVIQLHAGVDETVAALPKIVQNLRSRGFQFGKLP
jgi:peptidoglycan/xylan/chitin deacetylase (PgdA/CDA1 family)